MLTRLSFDGDDAMPFLSTLPPVVILLDCRLRLATHVRRA